jgi:CheY-like chemotaxis protein
MGDSGRLRQVLMNLVGNAVKFTDRGEIVVQVAKLPDDALQFSVRDTGVGIPTKKQKLIFEAFVQADNSTTRHYGGTGLGLTIASQLVALMKGRIWLQSESGKGSTFSFTGHFGIAEAKNPQPTAEDTKPKLRDLGKLKVKSLHILVVDDNPINSRLAKILVEKQGHTAVVAASGSHALRALAQESFDLALMDVQMPEMDGFEATQAIREGERGTLKHLPIIAMTAHAMSGDRERCLAAGMDAYVTKPVDRRKLFTAIAELFTPASLM